MGEPFWVSDAGDVTVHLGKCEEVLPGLPDGSADSIVTDPPAAIGFMGRDWDANLGGRAAWVAWLAGCLAEAGRVLKPGGHALVWSLPRTSHWTAWALEDAGFEIRDCIVHIFGQGFPKSLDVGKAIDRAAGAQREALPGRAPVAGLFAHSGSGTPQDNQAYADGWQPTAPATEDAARWDGWGTALKPGQEMWWLARKPFAGTVAGNVLAHGTGALHVDACKVGTAKEVPAPPPAGGRKVYSGDWGVAREGTAGFDPDTGRWPPNLVLSHSPDCQPAGTVRVKGITGGSTSGPNALGQSSGWNRHDNRPTEIRRPADADGMETVESTAGCVPGCPVAELDRQSGTRPGFASQRDLTSSTGTGAVYGDNMKAIAAGGFREGYNDQGGASRFYPVFRYQAKAPPSERPRLDDGQAHECVKPLGLIRWLARLVTPPGGTILDLFAGTGPVGEAAVIEGFRAVLIDQDPKSARLMAKRFARPVQPLLFTEGDM